jgi:lipase
MRLNVYEWGDAAGAPVVCLHGLTGYGGRFRRLAAERLPDRRVVAPDLRGHGSSGWEPPWDLDTHVADLVETASALGIDQADWVGHSIGGRLVAHVASQAPDLVGRAVLLDPAMLIEADVAEQRVELLRTDTSFASPDEAIDTRLADPLLYSTPRSVLEEEAAEHLALGEDGRYRWRWSPGMAIVAWSEMATAAPPWPLCPTLVVVGARSWIPVDVPAAPQLRTATVPGGHSVLWDDFDATADAIAGFLG